MKMIQQHTSIDGTQQHTPIITTDQTILTLTFRIGHQQYGLPVGSVIEIVRLPALITLAGAPPTIVGLLNLRGRYLPVLDGSILVQEPPIYDLSNQIVIAGRSHNTLLEPLFGLRVDQVNDVRSLSLIKATTLSHHIAASFLRGVIEAGDESVLMLDIEALIAMVPENVHIRDGASQDWE